MSLRHQRCVLHPNREAAACCPECRRHFCRECVTEHDGRLLCAACIGRLVGKEEAPARRRAVTALARRVGKAAALMASLFALWFFYALVATLLSAIPNRFHDSTVVEKFMHHEE